MTTPVLVGIDTGGTFTDVVVVRDMRLTIHKEPSTPDNPAEAVLQGLRNVFDGVPHRLVHGSTVATNALLERRGADTALLTTKGFEDVIEIGRQTRRVIYDIDVTKPAPLVEPDHRLGVAERVGPTGAVREGLTDAEIDALCAKVRGLNVDGVAICLLHSYANPEHEQRLAARLRDTFDGFVTTSYEVLPEFREYERTSTTVVNAYVGPVMASYLGHLERELPADSVRIMQSNGGVISLQAAQKHAVQTILSGPAGGAVGGFEIGRRAGYDQVITFDMGGTSTDVSLCPGALSRTPEASVGDLPIRVPVIDIHTVGAGGGSIAYRDPGGSLRVGPRSAGAMPGPICYGRGGTEITVTDANLFLGRLAPGHFLGGKSTLLVEPVREAMASFAKEIGLSTVEVANGVLRVANATMERAMRVISLERGFDPRDFSLVCFGGAGGMHAADLARSMAIPRVIVPQAAGILSALGMLLADVVRDYSLTVLRSTDELADGALASAFATLEARADEDLPVKDLPRPTSNSNVRLICDTWGRASSSPSKRTVISCRRSTARMSSAMAMPMPRVPTEVVNVRIRATGRTVKPDLSATTKREPRDVRDAVLGEQAMIVDRGERLVPLYDREQLHDQTSLRWSRLGGRVQHDDRGRRVITRVDVDTSGNLILERSEAS